jgi:glutathione S-transferase
LLQDHADLRASLQRVVTMWQTELTQHGGPMLFGTFSIADAFFAPVCMRIRTYGLPVPNDVQAYVARVVSLPSVSRWMQEALAEKDFIASQEPYRSAPQ